MMDIPRWKDDFQNQRDHKSQVKDQTDHSLLDENLEVLIMQGFSLFSIQRNGSGNRRFILIVVILEVAETDPEGMV